ncbi:hypothetical protein NDA10_003727 [Ustilago hordei]|nr:hypothetical protein NDA10_003727 [Ustilago hordei]
MVLMFHSGCFSIQVWASIAYNLKTPLVVLPLAPRKKQPGLGNQWSPAENLTAVLYHNWIIDSPLCEAVTAVITNPDGLSVAKDGSSCHQAAICKQWWAEYNIQMQEHLLASPDLNPIVNIWYVFKNLLGGLCHGPGCSRSRRVTGSYGRSTGIEDLVEISRERSAVSMETMDSYGLTCKGGPSTATRRTKLKEQAQPRRGPSSRSMQMVTTQGLKRQEPKELSLIKGEGAQCRRSRHSSRGTGVPSRRGP